MPDQTLITELKLRKAIPDDLKVIEGNHERLKVNFSVYLYDPAGKYLSGPILLTKNTNLERLAKYLKEGLIYVPENFYRDIPPTYTDATAEWEAEKDNIDDKKQT